MTDREKVIKAIETHINDSVGCDDCTYENDGWCTTRVLTDALALLKEQEAVTEYVIDEFQPTCKVCGFRPFAGYIPSLEWMRERGFRFCPQCGQKVKWNEE